MKFVRPASLDEVLLVTPEDEPTRDAVRACAAFGVWSFDRDDIGRIGAQLPGGNVGPVASLFAEWTAWLRSSDPRAPWSNALHSGFVYLLREGQIFSARPIILGDAMQIHDGRQRLFALFEFLGEHGRGRQFEVFWDRVE